jgi:hypothetical protein
LDQVSAVTDQGGVQLGGTTTGDLDDDEGGGLVRDLLSKYKLHYSGFCLFLKYFRLLYFFVLPELLELYMDYNTSSLVFLLAQWVVFCRGFCNWSRCFQLCEDYFFIHLYKGVNMRYFV